MSDRKEFAENFYSTFVGELRAGYGSECAVKCPFHNDNVESMSINLDKGVFRCHACGIGGDEYEFYRLFHEYDKNDFKRMIADFEEEFGKRPESEITFKKKNENDTEDDSIIPEKEVKKPFNMLMNNPERKHYLLTKRGITEETIKKFELGADFGKITIPIRDEKGNCVNIRRYTPEAKGTAKMQSWKAGYGTARLFPIENLNNPNILLCEGEMDCILANQFGFNALSTTGGASTWKSDWNQLFKNKNVCICYDVDDEGKKGALKVAYELESWAYQVKIIKLPIADIKGGDLTDYFVNLGQSSDDLKTLISQTPVFKSQFEDKPIDKTQPVKVFLSEATNPEFINRKIKMDVIVAGKDTAPFSFPKKINVSCNPDSDKCLYCGMKSGEDEVTVKNDNRLILDLINCTDKQQFGIIKNILGIPKKCNEFKMEFSEMENIEEVILQPELDFSSSEKTYTTRKAFVVGEGVNANTGYRMTGITCTDPKTQYTTHLITNSEPAQDNISSFQIDDSRYRKLLTFQVAEGQTVKEKFDEIASDLSRNITRIYGRNDIIKATDLVFHSVLCFTFQNKIERRGWVEGLIMGDTRTGKSETVQELMNHYKLGEFITGENTSFAGLVGGMQQTQKRWFVSWGKIPLNDRRLVIIDEASGLKKEEIENMSGVRSSGIAEITKIHQERTYARTRLLWVSNTRTGDALKNYGYGIFAIRELIGKNEDVARFEFAVTCASEEVPTEVINQQQQQVEQNHIYSFDLCRQLILWAWSRKNEQIHFTGEATEKIVEYAEQMSQDFVSDVPLVEGANQRIKLARMSVATACRVFSTDDGENVVVKPEHVDFAYDFLMEIYKKESMGYWDYSQQIRSLQKRALDSKPKVVQILKENQELAEVFLYNEAVNTKMLEDMCNMDNLEVRQYIQSLTKMGMISRNQSGYYKKTAEFIKILREKEWV